MHILAKCKIQINQKLNENLKSLDLINYKYKMLCFDLKQLNNIFQEISVVIKKRNRATGRVQKKRENIRNKRTESQEMRREN